jgi:hypothetical protein
VFPVVPGSGKRLFGESVDNASSWSRCT